MICTIKCMRVLNMLAPRGLMMETLYIHMYCKKGPRDTSERCRCSRGCGGQLGGSLPTGITIGSVVNGSGKLWDFEDTE